MEQEHNNHETVATSSSPQKNKTLVAMAISLFVVLVVGMFVFAFTANRSANNQADSPATSTESGTEKSDTMLVNGKHFYIDGVHTVAGEIAMPTPCDLLETGIFVAESDPEQITIDFTVLNDSENCIQVITPQRFKVSAEAGESATFRATFNGEEIILNLLDASAGETPEDFELYIKG